MEVTREGMLEKAAQMLVKANDNAGTASSVHFQQIAKLYMILAREVTPPG